MPAGSDGVVLLPYFAGERIPLFDEKARGVILGLTLDHRRGHLYRAVLEATGYAARHHIDTMAELLEPPGRVIAVGGGVRPLWTRIVSDITGHAQHVPRQTIGASYGNAYLAGLAQGLVSRDDDWTTWADRVQPNPASHDTYQRSYAVYRKLYPATRDLVHALT